MSGSKGAMAQGYRRQSRFDPMDPAGEDIEDEGYGDLGSRHPLRRVQEEGKEEVVNLPSLKSLFGPQGESSYLVRSREEGTYSSSSRRTFVDLVPSLQGLQLSNTTSIDSSIPLIFTLSNISLFPLLLARLLILDDI